MPQITRWFLKSSFLFLTLALTLEWGSSLSLLQLPALPPSFRPTIYHLLILGWLTQMIFGVAFWMFPKPSKQEYQRKTIYLCFLSLNLGLLLRTASEPFVYSYPHNALKIALILSALLQWIATLLFIYCIWHRLQPQKPKKT